MNVSCRSRTNCRPLSGPARHPGSHASLRPMPPIRARAGHLRTFEASRHPAFPRKSSLNLNLIATLASMPLVSTKWMREMWRAVAGIAEKSRRPTLHSSNEDERDRATMGKAKCPQESIKLQLFHYHTPVFKPAFHYDTPVLEQEAAEPMVFGLSYNHQRAFMVAFRSDVRIREMGSDSMSREGWIGGRSEALPRYPARPRNPLTVRPVPRRAAAFQPSVRGQVKRWRGTIHE